MLEEAEEATEVIPVMDKRNGCICDVTGCAHAHAHLLLGDFIVLLLLLLLLYDYLFLLLSAFTSCGLELVFGYSRTRTR